MCWEGKQWHVPWPVSLLTEKCILLPSVPQAGTLWGHLGQAMNSSGQHCPGRAGCWSSGHGFGECSWGCSGGGWVSSGFGVKVAGTPYAKVIPSPGFFAPWSQPSSSARLGDPFCPGARGLQMRTLPGAALPTRSGTCLSGTPGQAAWLCAMGTGWPCRDSFTSDEVSLLTDLPGLCHLGLCACLASPEQGEGSVERAPQHHHPQLACDGHVEGQPRVRS